MRDLSEEEVAILDGVIARWRDERPGKWSIEDELSGISDPLRPRLLLALIRLEVIGRARTGERPSIDEFRHRFPADAATVAEAFSGSGPTDPGGADAPTGEGGGGPPAGGAFTASEGPVISASDDTLSYSVARAGGRLESLVAPAGHPVLRASFSPGGVVQDRYRIDRELGRGGMGLVFLGRDLRLDRPVAVKVILLLGGNPRARGDDPRADRLRKAFAEEARIGANLTHPAIATVYDYGFHEGKPFTVFEYLPGQTLRDVLRNRSRLPLEELRLILGPLAQALDFAHAHRVVHRDLKPENLRATGQGSFKVLDLGLAREFGRDLDWSGFAGTPAYAAPEQAAGLPCDGRADQYALALIVYEALAGRRVFSGNDPAALLEMHRSVVPTWVENDSSDSPPEVRQALVRALAKDPAARFSSCTDLAVALGCQLLSAPVAPPGEVLLEADVERMSAGRLTLWFQLPWTKNMVRLALTHEALWSASHAEIRRWPLAHIERVEPWAAPVDDREAAEMADAQTVRRTHRDAEVRVRNVAGLHDLTLIPIALALCIGIIVLAFGVEDHLNRGVRGTALNGLKSAGGGLLLAGGAGALGWWVIVVARGLRRLSPWARWAGMANAVAALILPVAGVASAAYLLVFGTEAGPAMPLGMLIMMTAAAPVPGYAVVVMSSRGTSAVFSDTFRAAAERTPHLIPKKRLEILPSLLAGRRTLSLTLRGPVGKPGRVSFLFATEGECRFWASRLTALTARNSVVEAITPEIRTGPAPVVLMRNRPPARLQLLGPVEARGMTRWSVEAALLLRAAMAGADAVIDVHDEYLPDFRRTYRRTAGTAARAVDAEGRFELRSRLYANRVARVSNRAILFLLVCLFLQIRSAQFMMKRVDDEPGAMFGDQPILGQITDTALISTLTIAAVYVWPYTLTGFVRGLRWPQLLRPLALTLVAFGLRPLAFIVGGVAGGVATGNWAGLGYYAIFQLDPVNLVILFFCISLARMAWRSHGEFRALVPEAERRSTPWRRIGGGLAWAGSAVFTLGVTAIFCIAAYYSVADFLPTAVDNAKADFLPPAVKKAEGVRRLKGPFLDGVNLSRKT